MGSGALTFVLLNHKKKIPLGLGEMQESLPVLPAQESKFCYLRQCMGAVWMQSSCCICVSMLCAPGYYSYFEKVISCPLLITESEKLLVTYHCPLSPRRLLITQRWHMEVVASLDTMTTKAPPFLYQVREWQWCYLVQKNPPRSALGEDGF